MEILALEQISNIANIIGVVLIVISLVYVAIQIKQNTSSVRLQTVHDLYSQFVEAQASLAHDKELCEIYHRGVFKFDELTPLEQMRFTFKIASFFRVFDELHFQYAEGWLDNDVWVGLNAVVTDLIYYPGFKATWILREHQYSRKFQDYINRILKAEHSRNTFVFPEIEY